jgi:penicillin-binding protein 1A
VTSPLSEDPTLALGSSEMTLLELTSAYAAFAAGGYPVRPTPIAAPLTSPSGPEPQPPKLTPLGGRLRSEMRDLLQAVVAEGTGRAARLSQPVFGKTGTAQDDRDALFIGFTGDIIVGVWVGNDDHSPMRGVTGGGLPAEIWRDFTARSLEVGLVEVVRPPPTPPSFGSDLLGRFRRFLGHLFDW